MIDFELPMSAPKGYSYEYEIFNSRLISIWLRHHKMYDYNLGKSVRSIWGSWMGSPRCKVERGRGSGVSGNAGA